MMIKKTKKKLHNKQKLRRLNKKVKKKLKKLQNQEIKANLRKNLTLKRITKIKCEMIC